MDTTERGAVLAMHESGVPDDKPLADARKRLLQAERAKKPPKPIVKHPNASLSPQEVGMALGMRIAGIPTPKITQGLNAVREKPVAEHVVYQSVEAVEGYQETIARIRRELKLKKMSKALNLEERLWGLADEMVTEKDAKGVDATLRALHASEKIQAAVAGEGQKLEVTQTQPSTTELQSLIQVILQR